MVKQKIANDISKNVKSFIVKVSPTGLEPAIPRLSPLRAEDNVASTSLIASSDTSNETIPQNSSECQEQRDLNNESSTTTTKRRKQQ